MPRNDAGPHDDDPGPIETGPVRKGIGGAQYTSGIIQGSNISVGNASSINTQKIESDQLRDEALELLDDLVNALSVHESEIPAIEAATAAHRELASPRPKLRRVRQLLNVIAVNVESNVTLFDLISRIQYIVGHMSQLPPQRESHIGDADDRQNDK